MLSDNRLQEAETRRALIAKEPTWGTISYMRIRTLLASAWAALAVLISHVVGYLLAYNDLSIRAHILSDTGHGWIGILYPALALAGVVALVSSWVNARAGTTRQHQRYLLAASVAGFLSVELIERVLHEGTFSGGLRNLSTSALPVVLGLLTLVVLSPLLVRVRLVLEEFFTSSCMLVPDTAPIYARVSQTVYSRIETLHAGRGPPARRGAISLFSF